MEDIFIVGAARTAIGKFGGSLAKTPASELGALVIRKVLERAGVAPEQVSEVIMGQVLAAGCGQNPARQAAIRAGLPDMIPSMTINKVCGSGLKAAMLGAQSIANGDSDIVVAGGQESMSLSPHALMGSRDGFRMGDAKLVDTMIIDGLWDVYNQYHMGVTAENVAKEYAVTRDEQDQFAVESQQKAERAMKAGRFKDEIIAVEIPSRKGTVVFADDEYPRHGSTLEAMKSLKPAFDKNGTVTAGNASGINDGASAIVVMSASKANERGLSTFGTVESYASVGVEPKIMGIGPVPAVRKALARAGLELGDVDLFELNEAFAAQSLAVLRELDIDPERINPHGGAIALGHPIGASGGRILVTLLHEMRRRDSRRGLASLCVGGGQGQAAVIRNGANQ
jgi:acetyl-CoA C-acetyltransferase